MPEANSQRELSTSRDTEHRSATGGQPHSETCLHPPAYVLDEEPLVRGEACRVEAW